MNKGQAIGGKFEWSLGMRESLRALLIKKNRYKRGRVAEREREMLTGEVVGMGERLRAIDAAWGYNGG